MKYNAAPKKQWTEHEMSNLVEYIALYHIGEGNQGWPCHKNERFWKNCADYINEKNQNQRTGK